MAVLNGWKASLVILVNWKLFCSKFENLEEISQLIQTPDKFSFPSGHTAAAFLFAPIISTFIPAVTYIVFPWAILLGISRLFLSYF